MKTNQWRAYYREKIILVPVFLSVNCFESNSSGTSSKVYPREVKIPLLLTTDVMPLIFTAF